jgi:hypothetical protein
VLGLLVAASSGGTMSTCIDAKRHQRAAKLPALHHAPGGKIPGVEDARSELHAAEFLCPINHPLPWRERAINSYDTENANDFVIYF